MPLCMGDRAFAQEILDEALCSSLTASSSRVLPLTIHASPKNDDNSRLPLLHGASKGLLHGHLRCLTWQEANGWQRSACLNVGLLPMSGETSWWEGAEPGQPQGLAKCSRWQMLGSGLLFG